MRTGNLNKPVSGSSASRFFIGLKSLYVYFMGAELFRNGISLSRVSSSSTRLSSNKSKSFISGARALTAYLLISVSFFVSFSSLLVSTSFGIIHLGKVRKAKEYPAIKERILTEYRWDFHVLTREVGVHARVCS